MRSVHRSTSGLVSAGKCLRRELEAFSISLFAKHLYALNQPAVLVAATNRGATEVVWIEKDRDWTSRGRRRRDKA